jgi:hypothetical protein
VLVPQRFPILQFPSPPLIAAILAEGIARTTHGPYSRNAMRLSRLALLALLVWSAEEIATGANWFRRSLGIAGGTYCLATLARPRTGKAAPTAEVC